MASDEVRARWARLQELFEEALAVAPDARIAHLDAHVRDPELRADVASLLDAHDRQGALDELSSALSAAVERGDPPVAAVPSSIGPYRILDVVGTGGMGTVYRAQREGGDERPLAVKLLRSDVAGGRLRRRFEAELRILRGIDHPGIVRPVDEGVTPEGLPYFAMELVEGVPIDVHCDEAGLDVEERLRLYVTVCGAVDHAHRLGIVHRDLKPANVLVSPAGDVRLLDFGIAKVVGDALDGPRRETTTGIHLLTPEYGSPEQLLGEPVAAASDVYQLGLMLYRSLTGSLPPVPQRVAHRMRAEGLGGPRLRPPSEVVRALGDPRRPAQDPEEVARRRGSTPGALAARLEGAIDGVVLTALAHEPAARFRSPGALAEALRDILDRKAPDPWSGPAARLDSGVPGRDGARPRIPTRPMMKRLFGMGVGVLYFGIAYSAFSRARAGWADGHGDIGFWWTVITAFLTIAALAALVGTWIHTQTSRG